MLNPSHPPRYDHPNNIWWWVHIMTPLIMQFSTVSSHSLSGPNIPGVFEKLGRILGTCPTDHSKEETSYKYVS
jgi:hypothetical protein